jgi:uncharacterized protein (TIGR00369 family)
VDFVGTISSTPGPWSCTAVCDHVTSEVGLSRGEIRNGSGEIVALSTLWAAVIDTPPPVPSSTRHPFGPAHSAPDSLDSGRVAKSAGRLLDLSICQELGIACLEASDGRTRLGLPPTEDLGNSVGSMHGGAIALLGDFTSAVALASLGHAHAIARRLWMQIDYLRPVRMTGTSEFTAEVSWRSKRVAMVDGAVTGPGPTTAARIRQASLL